MVMRHMRATTGGRDSTTPTGGKPSGASEAPKPEDTWPMTEKCGEFGIASPARYTAARHH